MDDTLAPLVRPLYVMPKPVGSLCNMACDYCYYTEKGNLYNKQGGDLMMSEGTLEEFVRQYCEAQTAEAVLFTWHGGEPLLRPMDFYLKAMTLQQKYAGGRQVDNSLQTNGTLLTEDWCRFFRDNGWLIGVSIDGPEELHNAYRRTRGDKASFAQVMRGIELLEKYHVAWNVMGVVNSINADYPLEVYRFYKSIGTHFIQFTPIVERMLAHVGSRRLASIADDARCKVAAFSVRPGQYASFCCAIFDEWVQQDVGEYYVQLFDSTLACWVGQPPGMCSMAERCGHAAVVEHNGDLYSCDHFVFPQYLLGNIHKESITRLMYGARQRRFGDAKRDALPRECSACPWLSACNGGCPKDRFAISADGRPGLNYLCEDYRRFFSHVAPYMDFMAGELAAERAPANVMRWRPANGIPEEI